MSFQVKIVEAFYIEDLQERINAAIAEIEKNHWELHSIEMNQEAQKEATHYIATISYTLPEGEQVTGSIELFNPAEDDDDDESHWDAYDRGYMDGVASVMGYNEKH